MAANQLSRDGSLLRSRGLRSGDAPWLITASTGDGDVEAVLRVGPAGDATDIVTEATALRFARANGLAVPRVRGVRADTDPALLLIERLPGSSLITVEPDLARLFALGEFAAAASKLIPPPGFARRSGSVSGVDFASLRAAADPQPLLQRAEELVASYEPANDWKPSCPEAGQRRRAAAVSSFAP